MTSNDEPEKHPMDDGTDTVNVSHSSLRKDQAYYLSLALRHTVVIPNVAKSKPVNSRNHAQLLCVWTMRILSRVITKTHEFM